MVAAGRTMHVRRARGIEMTPVARRAPSFLLAALALLHCGTDDPASSNRGCPQPPGQVLESCSYQLVGDSAIATYTPDTVEIQWYCSGAMWFPQEDTSASHDTLPYALYGR